MKKEQFNPANKLSLDKETISKLSIEQLAEIAGGAEAGKSRNGGGTEPTDTSLAEGDDSCCFLSCTVVFCGKKPSDIL